MSYLKEVYAAKPETQLYKKKSTAKSNEHRKLLMGTWMGVIEDDNSEFYKVYTFKKQSYVLKTDVSENNFMKLFFVDVGQGDGTLIETSDKTFIVDGGANNNFFNYLTKWKYKWLLQNNQDILIDSMFISHFDSDHYKGLTKIINHPNFKINNIYHNGIARFHDKSSKRSEKYDTELGRSNKAENNDNRTILKTTFNYLEDCKELLNLQTSSKPELSSTFRDFLQACVRANNENRLKNVQRLTNRNKFVKGHSSGDLKIHILAPVPTSSSGRIKYDWFKDAAHTLNGHSLVLKFEYKSKSVLLGGDLNTYSEERLINHYGNTNVFQVDIAKSCHHGSGEFKEEFMKKINPFATIISSGENNYGHPSGDALGCAGKYSRGKRPIVFSTRLSRATRNGGKKIHYGLINVRTNGSDSVIARMKGRKSEKDLWDAFKI